MASMMICLFFFGMLHPEHAAAEFEETMMNAKTMSKFMPAVQPVTRPRPVVHGVSGASNPSIAQSELNIQPTILKAVADMEARSQEMKAEYQRLRARIEKLPQTDSEASFGSAASFGWLAAFVASVGLAASLGVAAVRKYSSPAPIRTTGLVMSAGGPAMAIPAQPATVRTPEVEMFGGSGARAKPKKAVKKAAAKKATKKAVAVDKRAISTTAKSQTYVDVTGRAYTEVSNLSPQYDEIGVLPPLGRWDPLGIREQGPERYRRFVEMEIKHGRLSMAAFLGVITTYSGARWPGYLSEVEQIKFSDLPGGAISSWAALPSAAWLQIVLFISFCEIYILKQDPNKAPGDVVPDDWLWARYPDGYDVWLGDGSTKQVGEEELIHGQTWKLNAERNNRRAAMMGITGMLIHEALTGNPVFPIGEAL
jgi:light-harvesting complex I chlorophyll a/b binding protein 1